MKEVHVLHLMNEFYFWSLLELETTKWNTASSWWANSAKEVKDKANNFYSKCASAFSDYMYLASLGESRYGYTHCTKGFFSALTKKNDYGDFSKNLYDRREVYEYGAEYDKLSTLKSLVKLFSMKWVDSFIGGISWCKVAQTVLDYECGKDNAPVFIDRCFDLRHNGGIMFDKKTYFVTDYRFLENRDRINTFLNLKRNVNNLWDVYITLFVSDIALETYQKFDYLQPKKLDVLIEKEGDNIYNYKRKEYGDKKLRITHKKEE